MKQTFKGWAVGLIHPQGHKLFLGRYKSTMDGEWYTTSYLNPCEYYVYGNLFETPEEAMDFWKNCNYRPYEGKDAFTAIPLKLELSVEVQGLGFDWNGLP